MFYLPSILFSCSDMLQNNSEETMEPAGRLNQSRLNATGARCGSQDADYVCLVYKSSSKQIPHFLAFFPSSSAPYTSSNSDINCKQRTFWSAVKKALFVRKCLSGPQFMASVQQKGCLCEPAHIACSLRRESPPEI